MKAVMRWHPVMYMYLVKYKYETSKEEDLPSFFLLLNGARWRWRRANSRSRSKENVNRASLQSWCDEKSSIWGPETPTQVQVISISNRCKKAVRLDTFVKDHQYSRTCYTPLFLHAWCSIFSCGKIVISPSKLSSPATLDQIPSIPARV